MLNKVVRGMISIYQWTLSPLFISLGGGCRFYPSCSRYALLCFERFSFFTALWYSCRRLLMCHPFCEGGVDWPPSPKSKLEKEV